ncbi:MAG: hypothetical protein CM1200mP39_29060 [Dehalococcoidia bacterium]|nr:MAG: hypothetical protein CM1200mP39_29060 [Dehalococcoidia bacterium]
MIKKAAGIPAGSGFVGIEVAGNIQRAKNL